MKLPDFLAEGKYGEIRLVGHRIDLLHIVDYYNDGYSLAELCRQFPSLAPDLVERVLGFYRDNKAEVDAYVARCHAIMDEYDKRFPRLDVEGLKRRMAERAARSSE